MARDSYRPPNASTAPAQAPDPKKDPVKSLNAEIFNFIPQLKSALPRHIDPDRLARIIMTEVSKTPDLAKCNRASFYGAILYCAQLGLEPGSALGHAYLIPRKKRDGELEVQLIVGFQGMIDLVERDGRVMVESHLVYEKDMFIYHLGSNPSVQHIPEIKENPGNLLGVYAIARYKDGRFKARYMSKKEIDAAKALSQAKEYGPWKSHYEEMAMKTAIRRLFKQLPKTIELAQVLEIEERAEIDKSQKLHEYNKIEQYKLNAPAEEEEDAPIYTESEPPPPEKVS